MLFSYTLIAKYEKVIIK